MGIFFFYQISAIRKNQDLYVKKLTFFKDDLNIFFFFFFFFFFCYIFFFFYFFFFFIFSFYLNIIKNI